MSPNASAIDNNNAPGDRVFADHVEDLPHPGDYIRPAPVTAAKQDQAWSFGSSKSQQSWVIQIGGNDGSRILARTGQDVGIRRAVETYGRGVNGIVSLGCEPLRQGGRQRHIDKESHRANSIVSSSANRAAYCRASSMS